MSELATQILVEVAPDYRADESDPGQSRYVFSYTVTVHNRSTREIQLLSRYWKITQGNGKVQEVRGNGVVGKQPAIAAGHSFRYTSRAVLASPVGVMQGSYGCSDLASGGAFEVTIAPFRLATPNQVH
ncbi:Co2+/Mg2+ efflux protein ApaG [Salinicola sp. DM10]|uniref:Co2+/Mg2+ efflux protein ApaG n=1 Tax=Salinicola sp. DM10 TaxID=2815721 RepID=UPI001A8C8E24|nr:Co2+/Mg2+ efflux protein ApaG [Salinicola sp. DM10]MCE3028250.1 Co2+/Mg2+ efflux protein ApaG [Salinicola sp. DM10]